jgi:hypothetical protein
MKYSSSLISRVKQLYPESPRMHELAEQGNEFLGRYLDDSSQGSVNVDTVLLATSLDKLQVTAREIKMKKELYSDWWNEVNAARSKGQTAMKY